MLPLTAPRELPCPYPHMFASSKLHLKTPPTLQNQYPRHPSPNRTGVHCTGTSGKKNKTSRPPARPWTPPHSLKTPRPLTLSQPAPTSLAAYGLKPPWKCTSQPSIPPQPSHPPAAAHNSIRPTARPQGTPSLPSTQSPNPPDHQQPTMRPTYTISRHRTTCHPPASIPITPT